MAFKLTGKPSVSSLTAAGRRLARRQTPTYGLLVLAAPFLVPEGAVAQGRIVYRVSTFARKLVSEPAEVEAPSISLNLSIEPARDGKGKLGIADYGNRRIRRLMSSGKANVTAGTGTEDIAEDGVPVDQELWVATRSSPANNRRLSIGKD